MRQSDFQLYAMSEIACLVVDLCWAAATYLWLLLVSKQPKQLQRYVCVCETFACSNCSHPAVTASHMYRGALGHSRYKGHLTMNLITQYGPQGLVLVLDVRVDFVFQSLALLMCAQSQSMAASISG